MQLFLLCLFLHNDLHNCGEDDIAEETPQIRRSQSVPKARIHINQFKNNPSKQPPLSDHRRKNRQGTNVYIADRITQINEPGFPISTAKQEQFFLGDEEGLLDVGTTPVIDYTRATTPSIGDVIYGHITVTPPPAPSRKQQYHDMMERLDEGYMMVFLIELSRLIATNNPQDVHDVIVHTEMIVSDLFQHGRLAWFGRPLLDVALKISIFLSEAPMDLKRSYAILMHIMLKQRKQVLSTEVNSIIDYADLLYNDAEGELLFNVLHEFEEFPNITKTGRELCDSLIENFLRPFRRLQNSERRQRLLDSINKALKSRFPLLISRKPSEEFFLMSGEGITLEKTPH